MDYVQRFGEDTTVVVGADMYGMNGDSDHRAEHHTDATIKKVAEQITDLAMYQSGETAKLLSSRQPFSDLYQRALQSVNNGQ